MNEKALKTLEYYKIIEQLESFATCSMGKALCRELTPLDDIGRIEVMQQETAVRQRHVSDVKALRAAVTLQQGRVELH